MADEAIGRIIRDGDDDGFEVIDPASLSGRANSGTANPSGHSDGGIAGDSGGSDSRIGDAGVRLNKDGTPAKRRGRKPGGGSSSGSSTQKKGKANLGGLEAILISTHLALAAITQTGELAIDKAEAQQLAVAINEVQDFYDLKASQEIMLWANLIGVAGMIYGPRIIAIWNNNKKEKAKEKEKPKPTPQPEVAPSFDTNVIEGVFVPHHAPES